MNLRAKSAKEQIPGRKMSLL